MSLSTLCSVSRFANHRPKRKRKHDGIFLGEMHSENFLVTAMNACFEQNLCSNKYVVIVGIQTATSGKLIGEGQNI